MSNKVLVATYGSLRRGMGNYCVNEHANAKFLFTGYTKDVFNLYQYGRNYFPSVSLVHNDFGTNVVVDVFETTQAGLEGPYDSLEGYPTFYNRTLTTIIDKEGNHHEAWMYHIDDEQPVGVPHGDWGLFKDPDYYKKLEEQNE